MNPEVLEKVLSCHKLPSLPAVAMRVVELTQDQKVSMRALAETIQNDQALTAKILKTVNSSLFGLRQKCSSINQAIIMLGMSAVKTLALGFSLVTAIKDSTQEFDLRDHWRRSLFTAVAAKAIAARAGIANPEEAFLGGLLQDLGVVALQQTLGAEYVAAVAPAGDNHRLVAKFELETFQLQHPDLGAMLAKRWRLPDSLVMPIKYHERPTAAPAEFAGICRAVGLGNIAADVLSSDEPGPLLRKYYERARQWFGLDATQADEVLTGITAATREVAPLLSVPTGRMPDADEVLARAREQLAKIQVPSNDDAEGLGPIYSIGGKSSSIDELTGLATRERFEQSMIAAFEQARAGVAPVSVVLVDIDHAPEIVNRSGADALDNAIIYVGRRLTKVFAASNALIARFNESRFGVLVSRQDRAAVSRSAEIVRAAVASEPVKLITAKAGSPSCINLTVSVGVVTVDNAATASLGDIGALMKISEAALSAAHKSGNNSVRVYQPAAA